MATKNVKSRPLRNLGKKKAPSLNTAKRVARTSAPKKDLKDLDVEIEYSVEEMEKWERNWFPIEGVPDMIKVGQDSYGNNGFGIWHKNTSGDSVTTWLFVENQTTLKAWITAFKFIFGETGRAVKAELRARKTVRPARPLKRLRRQPVAAAK